MDREDSKLDFGKACPVRFNIMVVGESGMGKSTFLRTIFRSYNPNGEIAKAQRNSKTVEIAEIGAFTLETPSLNTSFHLFDSPGYGDYINNIRSIQKVREYLETAHTLWWNTSRDIVADKDRYAADHRIHCIVYFFSPHRIKDIDREFLKHLNGLAPIVPVIGKADTMNISERREHLLDVNQMLKELAITCGGPIAFDFGEEGAEFLDTVVAPESAQAGGEPAGIHERAAFPAADLAGSVMMEADEEETSPAHNPNDPAAMAESTYSTLCQSRVTTQPVPSLLTPPIGGVSLNRSATSAATKLPHGPSPEAARPPVLPRVRNLFAVVCDASASGKREYPWGSLDIYDEHHSDTRRLQRLLFESANITVMRDRAQEMSVRLYRPQQQIGEHEAVVAARHCLWGLKPYLGTLRQATSSAAWAIDKAVLLLAYLALLCVAGVYFTAVRQV